MVMNVNDCWDYYCSLSTCEIPITRKMKDRKDEGQHWNRCPMNVTRIPERNRSAQLSCWWKWNLNNRRGKISSKTGWTSFSAVYCSHPTDVFLIAAHVSPDTRCSFCHPSTRSFVPTWSVRNIIIMVGGWRGGWGRGRGSDWNIVVARQTVVHLGESIVVMFVESASLTEAVERREEERVGSLDLLVDTSTLERGLNRLAGHRPHLLLCSHNHQPFRPLGFSIRTVNTSPLRNSNSSSSSTSLLYSATASCMISRREIKAIHSPWLDQCPLDAHRCEREKIQSDRRQSISSSSSPSLLRSVHSRTNWMWQECNKPSRCLFQMK